jgi:hypothetical protein
MRHSRQPGRPDGAGRGPSVAPPSGPTLRSATATLRFLLILLAVHAVLAAQSVIAAGTAAGRPRSVLEAVPGLEKRVSYSETKIPLGELIQKVAADTEVPLTTAQDVADEPVAVVVKDFPARELLDQLAELLEYQWSRRPTTDDRPPTTAGKSDHRWEERTGRNGGRWSVVGRRHGPLRNLARPGE